MLVRRRQTQLSEAGFMRRVRGPRTRYKIQIFFRHGETKFRPRSSRQAQRITADAIQRPLWSVDLSIPSMRCLCR